MIHQDRKLSFVVIDILVEFQKMALKIIAKWRTRWSRVNNAVEIEDAMTIKDRQIHSLHLLLPDIIVYLCYIRIIIQRIILQIIVLWRTCWSRLKYAVEFQDV